MTSNNLARHSRRRRQTRLTFDSAEPSSSGGLKPAKVRYEGSSPSRKKELNLSSQTQDDEDDDDDGFFPSGKKFAVVIETPPKSQEGVGKLHLQSLSSPTTSAQIRRSNRAREPSFHLSEESDYDDILLSSRPRRVLQGKPTQFGVDLPKPEGYQDLSVLAAGVPSQNFLSMSKEKPKGAFAYDGADSDGSLPEVEVPLTQKNFKKTTNLVIISDSSDESLLKSPTRAEVKQGQATLQQKTYFKGGVEKGKNVSARSSLKGGSSYSAPVIGKDSSSRPINKSQVQTSGSTHSSLGKRKNPKPIELSDSDSDSDVVLPTPRQTQGSSSRKSKEARVDESQSDDPISSPLKKRKRMVSTEESSYEDTPSPTKRLRFGRRNNADSGDEDEDEDEDEDDRRKPKDKYKGTLKKPMPKRQTRQQQKKQRKTHRTAAQKAMELAKRRRAGEKIAQVTSSEESSSSEELRGIYDSDSDLEVLGQFEDEEDNGLEEVRESLRAKGHIKNDDDFIVDDDDGPLGVPTGLQDIPLQFTHNAHKHLKEHFKDAVEWLVQKKINPLFPKDDPVYQQAFRKLDDEVHGYASSKFSSSAWVEGFHRALWARPIIMEEAIGGADVGNLEAVKCGACNRSNHPPAFKIQFDGPAYYKADLEEVDNDHDSEPDSDQDSDADSDASSSNNSVNSQGQRIPKENKIWYVGRFCKANAETAHSLIHWKYALNEYVLDKLKSEGHLDPEKLARREGWKTKKKSEFANGIVDAWEKSGEIRSLYKAFRVNLDTARDKKQSRWQA